VRPGCGRTWVLRLVRHRQHDRTYIHMTNRNGAHDEDCDMLVIGSGLGGSVVALQLTKKRYHTGLLAVGRRSPDEHFAEAAWDIKRFAWAPIRLKGTRRILWLPRVLIRGHFVNRCWRRILNKQSQYLPLLSAGLGCLRRATRRCAAPSSATEGRSIPSNSLAGLPWHEFVRRVAAAEAAAERAAIVRAHLYYGCPPSTAHPRERTGLAALMNRLSARMRTFLRAS
jgi:choline dehydrogenase-like flavoprotein